MEFPGQGASDPRCSHSLNCSCNNAGSLTHCAGMEPETQCSQDTAGSRCATAGTPAPLSFRHTWAPKMRAGNAGGLAHFLLCLTNRENQPLTPSPSNAFCHVRQERLPCLPELHQPFPGSCWAPHTGNSCPPTPTPAPSPHLLTWESGVDGTPDPGPPPVLWACC